MTEEKLNVPHVLLAIEQMTELLAKDGVSKDKTATATGSSTYKFRGIDDIRNVIAPLQKQCQLIILPCMTGRVATERTTSKGGFALHVVVKIDFHFTSTKDGTQVIVPMENEAVDYSDKATNKAISQAFKTVCINTFNIPTEGEEDADGDKLKDLKSNRMTAHASREACDKFVEGYLQAVSEAKTKQTLAELGALHAVTLETMKASHDEHERFVVDICRGKHKEALDEFRRQEAASSKGKPLTVGAALQGGSDD